MTDTENSTVWRKYERLKENLEELSGLDLDKENGAVLDNRQGKTRHRTQNGFHWICGHAKGIFLKNPQRWENHSKGVFI